MPAKRNSSPKDSSSTATIGKSVDDAMVAIERDWQMSNAEVRMTNRSRFTSTFEIQQSKFA